MADNACRLGIRYDGISCFSIGHLKLIAMHLNDNYNLSINTGQTREGLWADIKRALNDKCNDEVCWLDHHKIAPLVLKFEKLDVFKPLGPANSDRWLSNIDIDSVAKYFDIQHPEFEWLGVHAMNFAAFNSLLRTGNFVQKNKTKYGIILNTDYAHQRGSHWVAMFIHCGKNRRFNGIFYFNSSGQKPTSEILQFAKVASKKIYNMFNIKLRLTHNPIQKQYGNSECGLFTLQFIAAMLSEKKTFEEYYKAPQVSDKTAYALRQKVFREK